MCLGRYCVCRKYEENPIGFLETSDSYRPTSVRSAIKIGPSIKQIQCHQTTIKTFPFMQKTCHWIRKMVTLFGISNFNFKSNGKWYLPPWPGFAYFRLFSLHPVSHFSLVLLSLNGMKWFQLSDENCTKFWPFFHAHLVFSTLKSCRLIMSSIHRQWIFHNGVSAFHYRFVAKIEWFTEGDEFPNAGIAKNRCGYAPGIALTAAEKYGFSCVWPSNHCRQCWRGKLTQPEVI